MAERKSAFPTDATIRKKLVAAIKNGELSEINNLVSLKKDILNHKHHRTVSIHRHSMLSIV